MVCSVTLVRRCQFIHSIVARSLLSSPVLVFVCACRTQACLDKWRKLSANAASNTQCDQCFYVYRVERRGLAKFLRVRWVLEVASVLLLLVAVILAGFIVKWGR
jgi:hypothetical protein